MSQFWTVARKEFLEITVSTRGRGRISQLLLLGVFGILAPARSGTDWVDSKIGLFVSGWVPLLLVISFVADAFAGERERHTLETLLASRLSDRAILWGKILTIAAYGWIGSFAVFALGLITVNIAHRNDGILHFSLAATAVGAGFAMLATLLATTIGAMVSMRAATVRQAQQLLSVGVVMTAIIPGFGSQLLPQSVRPRISDAVDSIGDRVLVVIALVALIALTSALLRLAEARFNRDNLLLG